MYADRSSGRKRSVRDRLGSGGGSSLSRPDDAKRYRQADGTWRRELYQDSVGTQSSSELSSRSRQANKKSSLQPSTEAVKKSSVPDLREKLSGVQNPQLNSTIQIPKPAPDIANSDKPVEKRDTRATGVPTVPKKVSIPAPSAPKLSQEKPDASLDNLLKSLDLEKYLINFQAEEVDMKALMYMNEEDMKSLGIPMVFLLFRKVPGKRYYKRWPTKRGSLQNHGLPVEGFRRLLLWLASLLNLVDLGYVPLPVDLQS